MNEHQKRSLAGCDERIPPDLPERWFRAAGRHDLTSSLGPEVSETHLEVGCWLDRASVLLAAVRPDLLSTHEMTRDWSFSVFPEQESYSSMHAFPVEIVMEIPLTEARKIVDYLDAASTVSRESYLAWLAGTSSVSP